MNKNIEYSIDSIEELRDKFEKNNSLIIDKLKVLEKEYNEISEVLSTPNSNKTMPELYSMIKKYDNITSRNGRYFDSVFNTAIKEYSNFINELKISVGGEE